MSVVSARRHHRSDGDGRYFTVAEAARKLRVSHSTVWRWIDSGRLPAYRVGPKAIRIREQDLETVIAPVATTQVSATNQARGPHRILVGPRTSALTDIEVADRLAALERAAASRAAQLASRGGVPLASSTEVVAQVREELEQRA
jgi:excisionase family DNA binding protein